MIGHRTERHEAFGWAAARIDDVANFIPARLTGLLFVLFAGKKRAQSMSCMRTDARHHRSVNAGSPEAAMAGALGVRLCGPRSYEGKRADEPWLNAAARDPVAIDITRGLELYVGAMFALTVVLVVIAFI
jgi:adenosylcobinamide-phosphate synthase